MREEVKNWWEKAKADLKTAKKNFEVEEYEASALFCQQSVEKGLKALSIKRFKGFKKVHDLVVLGREVELPDEFINMCKELSPAYTYTRYPDVSRIKNIRKVSEELINYAEKVLEWIEKTL